MARNKFVQNVLEMMKGTSIAQITPILISPLLTRIYSPAEFGIYAIYISVLSILTPIVNARYELAIMLPKSERKALTVFLLSVIINIIVVSLILFTAIISFNLFGLVSQIGVSQEWVFLLPISLLLLGLMNPLIYLNNREQKFKTISNTKIQQTLGTGITQLIFGFLKLGNIGMILGNIVGLFLANVNLIKSFKQNREIKEVWKKKKKLKDVAFEYNNFPKYAMTTHSLEAVASNLPQFLLQKIFGASATGHYSLSMRTVNIPLTLIGKSIGDVFLSAASKAFREKGNCGDLYKKTFLTLSILPVIPFIILFLTAEELFVFIFGDNWRIAGEFTKILVPALYLNFIANPLSHMFIIAEKVRLELFFQILFFILTVLVFVIGSFYKVSAQTMVLMYSGALCLKNLISMYLSFTFSKGIRKRA